MKLRLLSYNIHKAIGGVDRRYRPDRIVDVIHNYRPDIVFLQEVDNGAPRSRGDRQVDLLGEALGMHHRAWQGNVRLRQGEYGNAILSRFPLSAVNHLDLTLRFKKPRRALIASAYPAGFEAPAIVLANCHLGLAEFERRTQLRRLLAHLEQTAAPACDAIAQVVGGDLNDVWSSLARVVMQHRGYDAVTDSAATFPAIRPLRSLDRLFSRGAIRALHGFVGHSPLARQASDHLPIIADFEVDFGRTATAANG